MDFILINRIKQTLIFLLVVSVVAVITYLAVYKGSFLPNGYEVVGIEKNGVTIKSFNLWGIEKDINSVSFSEDENWKIGETKYHVERLNYFYWILYFATSVSMILFFYRIRKGSKLWKATFESNIIFAILLPLHVITTTLNRIQMLVSG